MRHDVIGMKDYVASDNRPVDKCVADVEACDIYIIIVAWRYGFVPIQDNEEGLSITEMEYRSATANGKPRLAFLLDENAAWPPSAMDSAKRSGDHGWRVNALRDRLNKAHTCSIFTTPEHLANLVSASVTNTIAEMQAVGDATISPEDFLGVVSESEASFAPTIEHDIQAAATNAGFRRAPRNSAEPSLGTGWKARSRPSRGVLRLAKDRRRRLASGTTLALSMVASGKPLRILAHQLVGGITVARATDTDAWMGGGTPE